MLERYGLGGRKRTDLLDVVRIRIGLRHALSKSVVYLLWILVVALGAGVVAGVGGTGAVETAEPNKQMGSALAGAAIDATVYPAADSGGGTPVVEDTFPQVSDPVDSNWSAFGEGATRTGHVDQEGPVVGVTELWTVSTSGYVDSSPAVVDGTVYVGSGYSGTPGFVYALNATDGTEEWAYDVGDSVQSSPAVAGGTVYVGADDATVYAINASDGTEEWAFATGEFTVQSSPIVSGGTVYVGTNGKLLALNASDGTEEWNFTTDTPSLIGSSPAVAGGTVYVGSSDDHVYALDAASGLEQWNYTTDSSVVSSPAVFDGTVYIGSNDGNLYALDAASGTKLWTFSADGLVESSPAVANGTVYFGSMPSVGGTVYAVDAATGAEQWSFSANDDVESSPAVAGDTVYVGSVNGSKYNENNSLYALNASSGAERWNYTTGGSIESSPAVSGGNVYFGSRDENVYALTEPAIPDFQVTVDSTNSPVSAGDPVTVTATVQNAGSADGNQPVTLSIDGTQVDSTTQTLAVGASTQVPLSWPTSDGDVGDHTATVATEDDSAVTAVTVEPVNEPPSATFSASSTAPEVGETVSFDASGSSDSDGSIASYDWTFGDGTTGSGETTTHTYNATGAFTVTLTVVDESGATASTTRTLSVAPSSSGGGGGAGGGIAGTSGSSGGDQQESQQQGDEDQDQQDGEGETIAAVQTSQEGDQTEVEATVQNAQAGQPVTMEVSSGAEADTDAAAPAQLTSVSVTPETDATFSLDIVESPEPLDSSPGFSLGDGTTPVSYLSVEHTIPNAEIQQVTMTYRVDQETLEGMNSSPEDVSLYRHSGGSWVEQPTEVVGTENGDAVLQVTADSLSEWTAAAKQPRLDITNSDVSVDAATTGEVVTIQVFVSNTGGTDGAYDARLLLNGQTVDRRERTVPDGGTVAVNFERTFDQPGDYEIEVNDEFVAEIDVSAADESVAVETDQSADTDERVAEATTADADGTEVGGGSLPLLPIGVLLVVVAGVALWGYVTRMET